MVEPQAASDSGARKLGRRWPPPTLRWTVRARSTVLVTVAVAIAATLGDLAMLASYSARLQTDLDVTLREQAQNRADLLDAGQSPATLTLSRQEEAMVWIGQPDGTPIATGGSLLPLESPLTAPGFGGVDGVGAASEVTLLVLEQHEGEPNESGEREQERERLRVASVTTANGDLVVVVGAEEEQVEYAVRSLAWLLALGLPPLVAMAAALAWYTTGRALRPVEQIRSQATAISGASLSARVPVSNTGDEIQDLAETVNNMLDRLEAHDRSLRQFTADASHELKSPAANLRALVDTATVVDPAWGVLRDRLITETERLQDLVGNLLYLASSNAGRPSASPTAVALDELVFQEAEMVAAAGGVTVDLGSMEPAQVDGVESELQRLVRNLVDNGARPAASRLHLGIDRVAEGRAFAWVVGAAGPGINPADADRIFEPFTRLDTARARPDGGSGLGLSIVRQIAHDHEATVTVGRSPLGGAEFRVRFPPR